MIGNFFTETLELISELQVPARGTKAEVTTLPDRNEMRLERPSLAHFRCGREEFVPDVLENHAKTPKS